MVRWIRVVAKRFGLNGRRGAYQASYGIAYLALGVSYVFVPSSAGREASLRYITEHLPLSTIGWLWLIAGAVAVFGSRLDRPQDKWSFMALTIAPFFWGCFYLGAVFTGTNPHGWVLTVMYAMLSVSAMVVSGMTGDSDRDNRRIVEVKR